MAVDSPIHFSAAAALLAKRAHELRDGLALLARPVEDLSTTDFGAASEIALELLARVEVTPALGSLTLGTRLRLARLGCVSLVHLALLTVDDFQVLGLDCGSVQVLNEGMQRSRLLLDMIDAKLLESMPLMSVIRDGLRELKRVGKKHFDCHSNQEQYNELVRLAEQASAECTPRRYDIVPNSLENDIIEAFQRTLISEHEDTPAQNALSALTVLESALADIVNLEARTHDQCLETGALTTQPADDLNMPQRESQRAGHPQTTNTFKCFDFEFVAVLGLGSFGAVTLEVYLPSGEAYALKHVSKDLIAQHGLQDKTTNELNVLRASADCAFIATLHGIIDDPAELIFVMEPCLGGELLLTYDREGLTGSVTHTRFYVACVVCALEFLHEKHIVYRDLKPENLLLRKSGYAVLADMGIAKYVEGVTYTTCGAVAYFAPEVISQQGYGLAADWWSLGIFTYELITGHTPFQSSEPVQTYRKIVKGIADVSFTNFAIDVEDFIRRLCARDPGSRLPMGPCGLSSLTSHMWFHDFDWPSCRRQTMVPEFVPIVRTDRDVSNFPQLDLPTCKLSENRGTRWVQHL